MAFTPHWIDSTNGYYFNGGSNGPALSIRKSGNTLFGVNLRPSFPPWPNGYTSDDAGSTWTRRNTMGLTGFISGGTETSDLKYIHLFPVGSRLCKVAVGLGNTGNDVTIEFLNTTTREWEDYQLLAIKATDNVTAYTGSFADVRPDGSIIIAVLYREPTFALQSVAIYKWDAGTVTQLGTIPGGGTSFADFSWYELQNGFVDSSGNVHLFIAKGYNYNDGDNSAYSYNHVSVAAADDSISGVHLIEDFIEIDGWWNNTNFGTGCQLPDGSLATAYPYRTQTNYGNSSAYGYLRVALGDTSGDPLNPSWSVTTVNATPDLTLINGEDTFASPCWQGGKLRVYYASPYSRSLPSGSFNNNGCKLWRATYEAGWGTPEVWFDPPGDPDAVSYASGLFSFFLVRDFTNDVGIGIDCNAEVDSVAGECAAYDGPAGVGRFTRSYTAGQVRAGSFRG